MTDTEINEAVAKKLGWIVEKTLTNCEESPPHQHGHPPDDIFAVQDGNKMRNVGFRTCLSNYATSIEAAFEIVGKQDFMLRHDNKKWRCWLNHKKNDVAEETAPRAICLAFLKLEEK